MKNVIATVLLLLTMSTMTVESGSLRGYAAHYRVGTMERVARTRDMPIVACMIASSYYTLGTWLTVTSKVTGTVMECRVTDITQARHIAQVRARGIVIEFGAANILGMCGLKRVGQEPPRKCQVVVKAIR